MNKLRVTLFAVLMMTLAAAAAASEDVRLQERSISGTTLSGSTGHIVTPSAGMLWEDSGFSLSTAYALIATQDSGLAHIPSVNVGLFRQLELNLAMDSLDGVIDLLGGIKWKFFDSGTTEIAFGLSGQVLGIGKENERAFGGQTYVVSTFQSALFDQPALTSVLIGYTFQKDMSSDIDFSVGFDAPLFPSVFSDYVSFVFDVGNVSYSMNPSGNNPDRGIVNAGIRINPIDIITDQFRVSANVYGLDLLDGADRSFSAGLSLQVRLN